MAYYFVDTNIIIAYERKESKALITFIDDLNNHFFYTETVKEEIEGDIPPRFEYKNSGLSQNRKDNAYNELTTNTKLTLKQIENFKNDVMIIFEASIRCYEDDITPSTEEVYLLSHNLKLFRKFRDDLRNKHYLDAAINKAGFEHLIEMVTPEAVVPSYYT